MRGWSAGQGDTASSPAAAMEKPACSTAFSHLGFLAVGRGNTWRVAKPCPPQFLRAAGGQSKTSTSRKMAEGEGFEPPVPFQVQRFSSTPVGSDPFGKFSTLLDFSMAYKSN